MPARNIPLLLTFLLFLSACAASAGVYHKVLPGQTLYSISRSYAVDENYLARINGINDPTRLKAGQQLYIPGADRQKRVPVTVSSPVAPSRPETPQGLTANSPQPSAKPAPSTTRTATPPAPAVQSPPPQAPATAQQGRFDWPLRGKVLRRFGSKIDGSLCKGLEISARPGEAVASAAAGKVIYSGDGIKGYGNLIIVRHDDSYFTVYGFNQKNLVSSGAFVSKGQQIARAGTPPKGGTPRLYFEIRSGKQPVDPIFYLP
ncbi:zinc metalloendopeptidase M23 domain-containing protein [Desulfuromonas sp. DDH964]|nr:peptidoglycan DD-metalloendopeptidase family protein [Desulfuromonas sp. DDH964]AMV72206.1 zinc metalloendopeptidase M23 domain-containing protein [Desulfuromonas sp. DDH964]